MLAWSLMFSAPTRGSFVRSLALPAYGGNLCIRNHLIERYCSIELREYRRIFRSNDEVRFRLLLCTSYVFSRLLQAGQLDNVSRRFAWFRRILANHEEERANAFPPAWEVAQHLFARFAEITRYGVVKFISINNSYALYIRDDMLAALSKARSSLTVTLLLETMRQTLDFEQSIANKFGTPVCDL